MGLRMQHRNALAIPNTEKYVHVDGFNSFIYKHTNTKRDREIQINMIDTTYVHIYVCYIHINIHIYLYICIHSKV